MREIYVTGHKNPDTDSIVAAMSYAALRNALGDREYKAVRIGTINDETQRMLQYFGLEAPEFVKDMRNQVRDIDFDCPPELDRSVTMNLAWRCMKSSEIPTMPILNDDGTLFGMISAGDIASYELNNIYDGRIDDLPIFNLVSVLEGRLVNEFSSTSISVSGQVYVALPKSFGDEYMFSPDSVIICGNQPELIEQALSAKVSCLVLCQTEISRKLIENEGATCIISTPLDARQAIRLLFQAVPVTKLCKTEGIICFHLDDYIDDVKENMLNSRFRCYPVLDENDRVVGTMSRYHLLRPRRKRVVLVDHNEASQSVSGLEQVEIMEIIDHHRLADIQTGQPISVRNEPVGSTNTIITSMYQENGVMPSKKMAGLMAAAILSDTVMFKSPTCTKRDIAMAERLARIAGISLTDLGNELFSAVNADKKSVQELFMADFKQFHIAEHYLGVSQITCADSAKFLQLKDDFLALMESKKRERSQDMLMLMITDILKEGSHLLYIGNDELIHQVFSVTPQDNYIFLPGVMSRKKQIIPMFTAIWG